MSVVLQVARSFFFWALLMGLDIRICVLVLEYSVMLSALLCEVAGGDDGQPNQTIFELRKYVATRE